MEQNGAYNTESKFTGGEFCGFAKRFLKNFPA